MIKVLLVEDESLLARVIEDALEEAGYDVCGVANSADGALEIAKIQLPDLAVVDVRLAGVRDGIELADDLMRVRPMKILFATASPGEVKQRATAGNGCLAKPYHAEWLIAAMQLVEGRSGKDVPDAPPGFFRLKQ